MRNNSMTISLSQNSPLSDSESTSSLDHRNGSSYQCHQHLPQPPSTIMNQPPKYLPFAIPPTKKPRGRPLGSKNKSKLTYVPRTQPIDPSMKLVKVEVPPGRDIIESIIEVTRRGHVSLTILSANGMIASVTLSNAPYSVPALTLHGPFALLSLTGFYLYNNQYTFSQGATLPSLPSFGINLSTSQGQVFGGIVGGKVIAADDVTIVASTFKNAEIYRYVPKDEERYNDDNNNNNPNHFSTGDQSSRFNIVTTKSLGGLLHSSTTPSRMVQSAISNAEHGD
ncbi:AT-hook motif nuclear-localized protein 17, partial [Mucuna pruriens]